MLLLRLASANKTADASALISSSPASMTTTTKNTSPSTTVNVEKNLIKLESQRSQRQNGRQNQRAPSNASSKASVIQTIDNTNKHTKVLESGQTKTTTSTSGDGAASARLLDLGKRLIEAARDGNLEQVRHLVEDAGAPFTSDWLGTTALHVAAQSGHHEIADILIRGGVNRDARTKLERTALHLAAQSGSLEIVDLLLNKGSDVNCCDMLRMTPLHWATEKGHVLVARRLVMAGANVFASNKFLLTPIDIARELGSREMLELFRNWSLDINLMDNYQHQNKHLDTLSKNPAQILAMANAGICKTEPKLDHHHLGEAAQNSGASLLESDVACLNLVGFEWNKFDFDPDFFLTSESGTSAGAGDDFDDGPPKVEYLMKVVEKLQEENQQLRQKVEQLSTVEP